MSAKVDPTPSNIFMVSMHPRQVPVRPEIAPDVEQSVDVAVLPAVPAAQPTALWRRLGTQLSAVNPVAAQVP